LQLVKLLTNIILLALGNLQLLFDFINECLCLALLILDALELTPNLVFLAFEFLDLRVNFLETRCLWL